MARYQNATNEQRFYNEIGTRIRLERERCKLTQTQVGKIVGLTAPAISCIERGQTKADLYMLFMLAGIFNIEVRCLIPEGWNMSELPVPNRAVQLSVK